MGGVLSARSKSNWLDWFRRRPVIADRRGGRGFGGKHTSLALSVVLHVSLGSRRLGPSAGSAWETKCENLPVARDVEPARGGQDGHEMPQAGEPVARE